MVSIRQLGERFDILMAVLVKIALDNVVNVTILDDISLTEQH